MATGKRGRPSLQEVLDGVRSNGVVLEEIRAQNRATIEAVEATRVALEEKIDRVDRDSRERDAVLEAAVRQNSRDIRQNSDDVRTLSARVEALGSLDQRISALERRVPGDG
jgi:hypothetical protein